MNSKEYDNDSDNDGDGDNGEDGGEFDQGAAYQNGDKPPFPTMRFKFNGLDLSYFIENGKYIEKAKFRIEHHDDKALEEMAARVAWNDLLRKHEADKEAQKGGPQGVMPAEVRKQVVQQGIDKLVVEIDSAREQFEYELALCYTDPMRRRCEGRWKARIDSLVAQLVSLQTQWAHLRDELNESPSEAAMRDGAAMRLLNW